MGSRKYKVISFSVDRNTHEKKKEWLATTQGLHYGDYVLENVENEPLWPGLNFYWCFEKSEEALVFKLRWGGF